MSEETFLRQARQDAEKLKNLSDVQQRRLQQETDWRGYRMRGYEFPSTAVSAG